MLSIPKERSAISLHRRRSKNPIHRHLGKYFERRNQSPLCLALWCFFVEVVVASTLLTPPTRRLCAFNPPSSSSSRRSKKQIQILLISHSINIKVKRESPRGDLLCKKTLTRQITSSKEIHVFPGQSTAKAVISVQPLKRKWWAGSLSRPTVHGAGLNTQAQRRSNTDSQTTESNELESLT